MNEMVTIPKDEYLRLKAPVEDLADLKGVAGILQRLDVVEEELIPAAVSIGCSIDEAPSLSGEITAALPKLSLHDAPA